MNEQFGILVFQSTALVQGCFMLFTGGRWDKSLMQCGGPGVGLLLLCWQLSALDYLLIQFDFCCLHKRCANSNGCNPVACALALPCCIIYSWGSRFCMP